MFSKSKHGLLKLYPKNSATDDRTEIKIDIKIEISSQKRVFAR